EQSELGKPTEAVLARHRLRRGHGVARDPGHLHRGRHAARTSPNVADGFGTSGRHRGRRDWNPLRPPFATHGLPCRMQLRRDLPRGRIPKRLGDAARDATEASRAGTLQAAPMEGRERKTGRRDPAFPREPRLCRGEDHPEGRGRLAARLLAVGLTAAGPRLGEELPQRRARQGYARIGHWASRDTGL
ncbi:MAG: hypothetical protein AVDCRST_MAG01-01-1147, partial [uncultured Rubrobacteraceae bacterium]